MKTIKEYIEATQILPTCILNQLERVPQQIKETANEIRLRSNREVLIFNKNEVYKLNKILTASETKEAFNAICGYSVHSKIEQIKQGFITLRGGHRAGISGTAVYENGNLINISNINSINIRIARQIKGAADELIKSLNGEIGKTLIAGPPGSGKTTILKDIVRGIKNKRVSVIDTRGEIAATYSGIPQNNISYADIFDGYKRSEGMNIAIRTMCPDILVCDELSDDEDVKALKNCVGAGVDIIATVHLYNKSEINNRGLIKEIINTGAFKNIVILEGKNDPSKIKSIEVVTKNNENNRSDTFECMPNSGNVLLFTKVGEN